ncbi:uncharacterized protein LOC110374343, partial [Helicoverpa armigera]|uniref:uncharacterized protein LOC110374343 n=1 Tax=Helicoverpa armigera TaxID=29058 RepID=UPI0030831704
YLFFINCSKDYQETYLCAKTSLLTIITASSSAESKKLLKKFKVMVRILFFCLFVLITPLLLIAIWNYPFGRRETLSKSIDTLMPMTSPYYEIGLILHTVCCPSAVFLNFVIDLWFAVLLSFFCTASDSLVTKLKVDHDEDETELEYKDRLNNKLKTFYEGHATLMQFLSTLCKMFKWLTIIPLVNVLSSFCLTLFSISEELDWQFLCHALPCLVQILAYNWFGEQVKDKQTKLAMALLDFDWISMRIEDKKNYLIIISYMNKEYRIKTALGIDLSFVTLTSVLKASYQVNTILRTMEIQTQWIFLTNAVAPVLQTFAYNWFGEQVKVKKSQLDMALLEFDWVSMRQKDKRNYLIIISYMNKEFGIKTALGDDLSLVTMTAILKASYQAYTLLRTTET